MGPTGTGERPCRDPLSEPQGNLRHVPIEGTLSRTEVKSTHHRALEHEDVLKRHRARMQSAGELMRRRSATVEHPFGTIKCRAGYRHFLVRGFNKVRGEWSLIALGYNFTRVLNILGFDRFVAYMVAKTRASRKDVLAVVLQCIQFVLRSFWSPFRSHLEINQLGPAPIG